MNKEEFPFADLLGLKKKPKELTPEQELGKKLLQIAEEHKPKKP